MKIEIIDGPLKVGPAGKPRFRTATKDGKTVRLRIIDADSPRFAADLQSAFAANVRRARSENRELKKN